MTKLYFAIEDGLVIAAIRRGQSRCKLDLVGHQVRCVAVDPLQPEFIYCGTSDSGLWCSGDAGESWHPAGPGIPASRVHSVASVESSELKAEGLFMPALNLARYFVLKTLAKRGVHAAT